MVGRQCALQRLLSRDRNPIRIPGCAAARHPRQRRLQREEIRVAGHQRPHRPVSPIQPARRLREGDGRQLGGLRVDHRLRALSGSTRSAHRVVDGADRSTRQRGRGAGAAPADRQGESDHDRRQAVESRGHGRHRRNVSRRSGPSDALGFAAVPRGPPAIQTGCGRGRNPAGRRRHGDQVGRHHAGSARGHRGGARRRPRRDGNPHRYQLSGPARTRRLRPAVRAQFRPALVDRRDQGKPPKPTPGSCRSPRRS